MVYRNITVSIPLTAAAAKLFDKATYEYDDYFTQAVADGIADFAEAYLERNGSGVSQFIQRTANEIVETMDEMNA